VTYSRLEISDVILCEPKVFGDNRGYFTESFNKKSFDDFLGKSVNFLQDNESQSSKGVFRGLHYQIGPYAQAKLVRVISGSVIDFIVDIRKNSKGFAHGFLALEDNTIFSYKVDNGYSSNHDRGININDPSIKIELKEYFSEEILLSKKDQSSLFLESQKDIF